MPGHRRAAAGLGSEPGRTSTGRFPNHFSTCPERRLFNGERWIDSTAGDFLHVPEGGVHAFHNESDERASMLLLFAPGVPREGYFEALAEIAAGRKFSDAEWREICRRHDSYFL
jgi:hypothetical protein